MKKDIKERKKLIAAMKYIVWQVSDKQVFDHWLVNTIPLDNEYGDLSGYGFEYDADNDCILCDYMRVFLETMEMAKRSGGLRCNGVSSEYA